MEERVQALIAGIAAGAAEGAAALRERGMVVGLDVFAVEARIEGTASGPTASIRIDIATAPPDQAS